MEKASAGNSTGTVFSRPSPVPVMINTLGMILENYLTWEWNSIQLKLFYIQKLILSQYFCKNLLVAINPFYFDKDFSFFPNCFTLLICQLSCVILKDSFFSFFFLLCSNKRKMEDIRLSRICLCYNVNNTNCFFSCCWTGILKMCGCWCGNFSDKYRNWNKSLYMMIQNMVLWSYLVQVWFFPGSITSFQETLQ